MSSHIINTKEFWYIRNREDEVGIDNLPWHISRQIASQRSMRGIDSPKDYVGKNQADIEEICEMLRDLNNGKKNKVELSEKEIDYFQSKIPKSYLSVLSKSPYTPDRVDLTYLTKKIKEINNPNEDVVVIL